VKPRHLVLGMLVVLVGTVMIVVARQASSPQAFSLRPGLDRAIEAKAAVEVVGESLFKASDAEEIALGDLLAGKLQAEWPATNRSQDRDLEWLQEVLARLQRQQGLRRGAAIPYSLQVIETPAVNAFALPGGRLYVTRGMLGFLESEAEAAALLGHEMAHVDLRHCIERYQYALKAQQIGGEPLAAMASLGHRLMLQGYQDEQESEADRWGLQIAARASYHPQGGQRLFARLGAPASTPRSLPAEAGHVVMDSLEDLLASHPDPRARIAGLDQAIRECRLEPERRPFYVGRLNCQERLCLDRREYPEEWVQRRLELGDTLKR
jgi:predicted Zn-dependent protease